MDYFIITVLHNRRMEECETFRTLLADACEKENISVIAVDNSSEALMREENRRTAGQYGMYFLDMKGNAGLPAAYNHAIDFIAEHLAETGRKAADTRIILTDHDTVFPASYPEAVKAVCEENTDQICAPCVKCGGFLLSPCRKNGLHFEPLPEIPDRALPGLYYINAGLVFPASVFLEKGFRYDESLFLDFADFDLEEQLRLRGNETFVLLKDIVLEQGFSGTEDRAADTDLKRYRQYVRDGKVYYEKWHPGNPMAGIQLFRRGLKLAVKHKDTRFLKKN